MSVMAAATTPPVHDSAVTSVNRACFSTRPTCTASECRSRTRLIFFKNSLMNALPKRHHFVPIGRRGIMNAKRARRRAAGNHADAEAGDDQRNPMRWCEYAFEQYKGEPAEQRADGARHPRKESAAEAKRNPVKRVRA